MCKSEATLAIEYDCTPQTICRHVSSMRKHSIYKRYIYGFGKGVRIDEDAYSHYRNHRSELRTAEGARYWDEQGILE